MTHHRRHSRCNQAGDRRALTLIGLLVVAVSLLSISGCASTISAFGQMIDETVGAMGEASEAEAPSGEQNTQGGQSLFGGLEVMENVMLFNVAYMQVVFLGGHDPGFEDFREGEGVTWEVTGSDNSDESTFVAERALLKRNSDGSSWWYLGYDSEGEVLEYEVLMDPEYVPLEIIWKNEGSEKTTRYTFNYEEEAESPPSEEEAVVYSDDFYDEYSRGKERVTVGAGTFSAERVSYEYSDPQTGESLAYDWWVTDDVPGNLVKYEYRDTSSGDGSVISGELIATDRGYRTKFNAY